MIRMMMMARMKKMKKMIVKTMWIEKMKKKKIVGRTVEKGQVQHQVPVYHQRRKYTHCP